MKKRVSLFLVLILSTFLVTAVLVSKTTNKWESSSEVSFNISGFDGNLSEAITQDLFRTNIVSILDSVDSERGHNLSEIWVSVDNVGMNFKDAIGTTDLCGMEDLTLNYTNTPDPSHVGTEIEISPGKSLQDAINDGSLVSIDGGWDKDFESDLTSWWGTCTEPCGTGTQTRTRTCTNPALFCGGLNCVGVSSQTRNCNTQACSVPDVYGAWTDTANCLVYGMGDDGCNGDKLNAYTCPAGVNNPPCTDTQQTGAAGGHPTCPGGYFIWWRFRTVDCNI